MACLSLIMVVVIASCFGPGAVAGKSAAEALKAGDTAVSSGQHTAAVRHYTAALEIDASSPLIYTKRAAAYIAMKKQKEALGDLGKALELDPKMVQAMLSRGKVHRMLCHFSSAESDFKAVLSVKPGHKAAVQELATLMQARDAFNGAKRHLEINDIRGAELKLKTASNLLPDCPELLMLQCNLAFKRRDYGVVISDLGKLLKVESGNIQALIMRGWAYLHTGEEETGVRHFQEALRFDPEHNEAKLAYKKIRSISKLRKKGQEAMASNDFRGAEAAFLQASQVDPSLTDINVPFIHELCRLQLRIGKAADALESCQSALQLNPQLIDCAVNKVKAMLKLERFDEAVQFARGLAQQNRGNGQVHQVLQEAERALKISKQKDYYKILGVDRRADAAAIKKQYRALARKYHPDKVQGDEAEKAASENKFREVAEAYEVLIDPEKRSRFDRGEDLDQPAGQGGGWPGGGQHFHFQQRRW